MMRRLRGSKLDPVEMASIRRWSYEQGLSVGRTDDQLLCEIARAACDGRITMTEGQTFGSQSLAGGGGSTTRDDLTPQQDKPGLRPGPTPRPQNSSSRPALPLPPTAAETKTWIEFRLLDETTDKPVSGVAFRIQLTDGSIVEQITDAAGLIRIDGIDPGVCGIREIAEDTGSEVTRVN